MTINRGALKFMSKIIFATTVSALVYIAVVFIKAIENAIP
mgnify:FL=1